MGGLMPWVKLDDGFFDHPKALAAGPLGIAMFVAGLCYCSRHLTDGFIPAEAVPRLISLPPKQSARVSSDLVRAGLWRTCPGGFIVHDYLEYQPSRAQVNAERQAARKRMHERREWVRQNSPPCSPEQITNGDDTVRPNNTGCSEDVREMFGFPVPVPDICPPSEDDIPPHIPPESDDDSGQTAGERGDHGASEAVTAVMDEYNRAFGDLWRRPLKLTRERARQIKVRLRQFSVDDLREAIRNMRDSPWHAGQNDRGWVAPPEFLFRNDAQVDRFLNRKEVAGDERAGKPTGARGPHRGADPRPGRKPSAVDWEHEPGL